MRMVSAMGSTVLTDFQGTDMGSRITLRRDNLTKFRRIANLESNAEFAQRIGVNKSQLNRVLAGTSRLGTRFIAGCLEVFGVDSFADLFAVEPDDNGEAA